MKLIHLSDLHLGKRLNEFSLLEDQRYILSQILEIIRTEAAEAVLIAGDIYDKAAPSAEAVQLFDDFLCALADGTRSVFVVAGNHDSPERIAFGGRLMSARGVYMSPVYNGVVEPIRLKDEFGPVNFYLLPFIKPAHVRRFFPEEEITGYTEALSCAIGHMNVDGTQRNILVCHQFVTGALRSDSEDISVGGTDNVDASVFAPFDYTALGHIHGPQNMSDGAVRYCGTPLKYSFSECRHEKSVTVIELGEKGHMSVRTVPLVPLRDMRVIRGTYMEVSARSFYSGMNTEDYLQITLTDEYDIPEAIGRLRAIYPNIMKLDYDNSRTGTALSLPQNVNTEAKTPLELFSEFYEQQNNSPMEELQLQFSEEMMQKIWEAEP